MTVHNSLSLIQGYYHFLYMGKYLDQYIKTHDLKKDIKEITIQTGPDTTFGLNSKILQTLFSSAYKNPSKENIFGYMTELNAFRGIVFTMRELIESSESFKTFLQKKISRQYFPFEQIIRFARNILAHSFDPQVTITKENFIHQKTYWADKGVKRIHFLFKYYHYREERAGDKDYGIDIHIDFDRLKPGTPFYTAISRHQLYLLSELCYNLTKVYLHEYNTSKKIIKTPIRKPTKKGTTKKTITKTKQKKNKKTY